MLSIGTPSKQQKLAANAARDTDSAGRCSTPWRRAGQQREVPHILFFTLFSQLLRWLGKFHPVIYPVLTLQLATLPLLIHFPRHFS